MSTRKRSRKVDSELASTQQIRSKITKTKKTTHATADTNDSGEYKTAERAVTMNAQENELFTVPFNATIDNSSEFDRDSNSGDNSSQEFTVDTEGILREADVLIAQIAEFRRERSTNHDDGIDSEATIIVEQTNAVHPSIEQNISANAVVARTSVNDSATNNTINDSVVLIDDPNPSTAAAPLVKDDDEDVIFVNESRGSQRYRTIATIDLCDTPDTSFTSSKNVENASTTANGPQQNLVANRPGATKCPICLEMFSFDEILSTMCGHLYCGPCIKNVIKTRKKCPMCNRGLKPNQVHRIFLDT